MECCHFNCKKESYYDEDLKHTDILDLKALEKDMKVTIVKKDEDDQQVRWNYNGSITLIQL